MKVNYLACAPGQGDEIMIGGEKFNVNTNPHTVTAAFFKLHNLEFRGGFELVAEEKPQKATRKAATKKSSRE